MRTAVLNTVLALIALVGAVAAWAFLHFSTSASKYSPVPAAVLDVCEAALSKHALIANARAQANGMTQHADDSGLTVTIARQMRDVTPKDITLFVRGGSGGLKTVLAYENDGDRCAVGFAGRNGFEQGLFNDLKAGAEGWREIPAGSKPSVFYYERPAEKDHAAGLLQVVVHRDLLGRAVGLDAETWSEDYRQRRLQTAKTATPQLKKFISDVCLPTLERGMDGFPEILRSQGFGSYQFAELDQSPFAFPGFLPTALQRAYLINTSTPSAGAHARMAINGSMCGVLSADDGDLSQSIQSWLETNNDQKWKKVTDAEVPKPFSSAYVTEKNGLHLMVGLFNGTHPRFRQMIIAAKMTQQEVDAAAAAYLAEQNAPK